MLPTETVLLVEDNEDDVYFLRRAWQAAGIPNPLAVARDGQEALDYLLGRGRFTRREEHPLPALVLLDLKLPFRSGHEVLAAIRAEPGLRRTVAVVLTSSRERADIRKAYEGGANGYLVKPGSAAELADLLRSVRAYWLDFNVT